MLVLGVIVCILLAYVIAFLVDSQNRAARLSEETEPVGEVDDADPAPSPASP